MMMIDILDYIVYRDEKIIAINKPAGLAVQSKDPKDLQVHLSQFLKTSVHPIFRIDQPATGLVLFALDPKMARDLSVMQNSGRMQKEYLAVVGVLPEPTKGHLAHFLKRHPTQNRMEVTKKGIKGAQIAELTYSLLASSDRYHLLQIHLITGRQHQIRVQLAAIDSPIKGDDKYGFKRRNRDNSIHLHSYRCSFPHPLTKEQVELTAPFPMDVLWQYFDAEEKLV